MTCEQLARLVGDARALQWSAPLNRAMKAYGIDTPLRQAHFLAQVLHESGGLRYLSELWGPTEAQRRYDTRADLGNTPARDGDGYRYRGRGLIQLTGRANYRAYSEATGVDFVGKPHLVATNEYAADVAGWFWRRRGLDALADRDDLEAITRSINGGLQGLAHRRRWLERAKAVLIPPTGDLQTLVFNGDPNDFLKLVTLEPDRVVIRGAFVATRRGDKLDVREVS